jgi:hypothetical protein
MAATSSPTSASSVTSAKNAPAIPPSALILSAT